MITIDERKKVKVALVERKDERRENLIELTKNSKIFDVCLVCKNSNELMKQVSNVQPDMIALNTEALKGFMECCDEAVANAIKLANEKEEKIKKAIKKKMLDIGIPTKTSAFSYIGESIFYMIKNKKCEYSVVKDIYPTVAKKHSSTPTSVESSIRKTLAHTYEQQVKNGNLRLPVDITEHKMASNAQFLSHLAEIIALDCNFIKF